MAPPARQTKSPGWAVTTRPVFMGTPSLSQVCSISGPELEQACGIGHQYLLLQVRLRREQRHEVDEIAVIRHYLDVGMRPVRAPDDAVGGRLHSLPCERHG